MLAHLGLKPGLHSARPVTITSCLQWVALHMSIKNAVTLSFEEGEGVQSAWSEICGLTQNTLLIFGRNFVPACSIAFWLFHLVAPYLDRCDCDQTFYTVNITLTKDSAFLLN
jgi:hypothetical protein